MTSQRGKGAVSVCGSKGRGTLARFASYLRASAGVVALLATSAAWAQQLPTGGSVAAGTATIAQPNSSTLNINQSTNQAVINWNAFSVGRGGTVNFNQPGSSSATLNRVTGSTPSWIAGTINAPGTVLLVNPNGIAITKSGVINTGSFAASTLDISNADFMAGNYKFTGNGGSAAVRNSGRINVSDGGFAALLGGQVANNGVISARLGKVGLGAGELITLDLAGDGFLSVAVPSSEVGKLVDASGALVTNSGKIRANGGSVFLTAATASNILRDAVNVPGSIRANTVGTHNGRIVIGGGTGGKVNVTGKLRAKSKTGKGGHIVVTGKEIALAGATLDASGKTGGGNINIGGGYQGSGTLPHAEKVTIDANSVISADALVSGDGGNVIVWSDGATRVAGSISAAGAIRGKGGLIETSGHNLNIGGIRVKAGPGGRWLLDPDDLAVDAAAYTAINAALATTTDVELKTTSTTASGFGTASGGNGDIILTNEGAVAWSTTATLTLNAYRNIVFNSDITVSGGGKLLVFTGTGGTGDYLLGGYNIAFTGGAAANAGLSINGNAYTLLYDMAGVQNVNSALGGLYALAVSLDATATSGWVPLGTDGQGNVGNSGNGFFGTFAGLGHSIANLTVNIGTLDYAGLFGYSSGKIRDIGLVGDSVTGGSNTGGLVGLNAGSISNAYATGAVSGNASFVGGLVGLNVGPISTAYATGAVSGQFDVGGLVGANGGSISNAYATGAVSGVVDVGGLVGFNVPGSIDNAYATGSVSLNGGFTSNNAGGLVGAHNLDTISNAYWDTQTSGQTTSAGGTGLTTVTLQGALPAGFDPAVWGTGPGLYPYLKSFFPNGVQAVSGFAYSDSGATPLSSNASGPQYVSALVNGQSFGSATTGANGYYYLLAPAGTISGSGSAVIAYTSGVNGGARVDTATGSLSGFDIWGGTLIAPTTATTYSTASATSLQSQNSALIASAVGANVPASALVAGLPQYGYIATGSSFTIDQPLTLTSGLYVQTTASNADITVAQPIILPSTNGLSLLASGNLVLNADVTITDAGAVAFAAGGDYSLNNGASVTFTGGSGSSASLSINGNAYTLLYDIDSVQNINAGLGGYYALAVSIDGSSPSTPWVPIGTDGAGGVLNSGFAGTFAGLGHTISNLTVDTGANNYSGVFGYSSGTLRDVGVVDAFVNGTNEVGALVGFNAGLVRQSYAMGSEVTGDTNVGGLVGNNNLGIIVNSYATVDPCGCGEVGGVSSVGGLVGQNIGLITGSHSDVTVFGNGNNIGGLVGFAAAGSITTSYATGTVFGDPASSINVGGLVGGANPGVSIANSYATGSVEGGTAVGGLIGYSLATVTESYATGNVRGANQVGGLVGRADTITLGLTTYGSLDRVYATGLVGPLVDQFTGDPLDANNVGGLVGFNSGSVTNAYATGAVAGALNVGGLFGFNDLTGSATNVYAVGFVVTAGPSATSVVGALAGVNQGTFTNAYWNTQTSGQSRAIGVVLGGDAGTTGNTTAELQAALPANFDSSIWGVVPGVSYSYFNWRFPTGPTVVSGNVSGISGGNSGLVVGLAIDGSVLLPTNTASGADGSYYFMVDQQPAGSAALTWLTQDRFPGGFTSRFSNAVGEVNAQGHATGLDLASGRVLVVAGNGITTFSGVAGLMERALYGTVPNPVNSVVALIDPDLIRFDACVCSVVFAPNTKFRLQSAASSLTFDAPLGVSSFVGGPPRDIEIIGAGSIVIDQAVTAERSVLMTAPGDITIGLGGSVEADGTGNAIVLAGGIRPDGTAVPFGSSFNFINNAGPSALNTPNGRWLIYSAAPAGNTFGDLDSGNAAVWNATYATLPPGSVTATGNRYVFAQQPTLTFTSNGTLTKTYGDDATAQVAASSFTVSGLQTVANAFDDTALDVYSGGPALTSTGSATTADVAGNPYGISVAAGTLSSLTGYAFAFVNNGILTINKATLTFTAASASRDYGDANPALNGSISGFKNGQTATTFGGDTWTTLAGLTSNVGSYGITGGLTNASPNYTITQAAGNATALTINKATLTFTANATSRDQGVANPALSGAIVGFKNGQTATSFGGDVWTTPADQTSPAGSYAIAGALTGASPNYRFAQAGANATALTIRVVTPANTPDDNTNDTTNKNSPSQVTPPVNPNAPSKDVNISFQPQGNGPVSVSFTPPPPPPVRLSNTPSTDIAPASLPTAQNLATNNGLTYPPISQFDPNQYSRFKTADWAAQASEATVFTMIARGVDQQHAADAMIDGFWNGTSAAWTPPQSFTGKVTFSDGAGNTVNPTGNAGFPITAGTTDLGQLLKNGPVMISDGATPAHWLLATQMTADGKGIVANDPTSGKQVVLNYDPATKTVGGVTSVFDANSNKFVPFAEASAATPALAGLQSFVPSNFLAVATK